MSPRLGAIAAVACALMLALAYFWPSAEPTPEPLPAGWFRIDTSGVPPEARVGHVGFDLRPGMATPQIVDHVRTVRRSMDDGVSLLSIEWCGDQ